ncbi:hypothetical protein IT084_15135 [Desulfallas sp. Bu1-1]|uniref:hypothetical protein n=1 Tax=Desulfallas sp. Bu1-1 TaxID=2787620 RepID=UPI0018A0127D|nr:hypothetical protein [Desulfallas sp. Bu1-1]MBF7084286.1 hypothetical protein [Desulfallas sp. Bu1-1]
MREDNITCIQHAKFIFDFFEKREWAPGEESPLKKITGVRKVEPGAVRNLGAFLSVRLDRIARMMEILLSAHDNWAVTGKKDRVIMETNSFDFNDAIRLLKEHGFHDDEFVLQVEYERKWGML